MNQEADLIRARLKTPRVAAIAGILFSVLLIAGLLFIHDETSCNAAEFTKKKDC